MKKFLCLMVALCLAAGTLAGCQNDAQQDGEQEQSGTQDTLVMVGADVATLDPGYMSSSYELWVASSVYDTLTWTPLGSAEPQMRIAESYTVSDDGLVYTFTLRDDVLFHNGEKVTPDDVLYSIEIFRSAAVLALYSQGISDAQAEGNTLTITLSAPDPAFWDNINRLYILPRAAHEAADKNFGTSPIGSGPYETVSYTAGEKLVLKAFPDYYRGPAAIENCEIKMITDATTAMTALETGEVHFSQLPFTQLPVLQGLEHVKYETVDVVGSYFVFGVLSNPPYDNLLVRQAIAYSLDRQMCSDVFFGGQATLAPTPVASAVTGTPQTVQGYSYDPEKAKELLAEAGYPDGAGLRPISISAMSEGGPIAEIVQANLSALGIEATVDLQEINTFISNAMKGNVDLCVMNGGCGNHISQWGALFTTGGQMNFAGYSNARVDELFAQAPAETDAAARQAMYEEAIKIAVDEDAAYASILTQVLCLAYSEELDIEQAMKNRALDALMPYDICFR